MTRPATIGVRLTPMHPHPQHPVSDHLTYTVRPRMFREPWQRWVWAVVPLVSLSVLAFVPFAVAWRRGVIPLWAAAIYFAGSATVTGFAIVQPEVNALFPISVWAFMITAVVHVLLLDPIKRQTK
ncbi:hypothetical protein [Streptomyces sp. NPDC001091]